MATENPNQSENPLLINLPADASEAELDKAVQEKLRILQNLKGQFEEEGTRHRKRTDWIDGAIYVFVGGLSVTLAFRIISALRSGNWNSLGALDFRLFLAWLFGTLCALRNRILRK
jgi:hypothetical protein